MYQFVISYYLKYGFENMVMFLWGGGELFARPVYQLNVDHLLQGSCQNIS